MAAQAMTLGNAAAARVRLITSRKGCQYQVEPDPPRWLPGVGGGTPFSNGASGAAVPGAVDRRVDKVLGGRTVRR
jgi:hypothetical protein